MAQNYRQNTIPDDWEESVDGYCLVVACVPNSARWKGLFNGLIDWLGYGRYYNSATGSIRSAIRIGGNIIDSVQFLCEDSTVVPTDTINEILTELNEIKSAQGDDMVTVNVCTCGGTCTCGASSVADPCINDSGSQGAGQTAPDPNGTDVSAGGFPTGFFSVTEYEAYKCNMAQQIVNEMKADSLTWKNNLEQVNDIASLVALVAVSLLTPIPGDEIIVLAGIAIGVVAIYIDFFDNVLDVLNTIEQDLICAMFEAPSVQEAMNAAKIEVNNGTVAFGTVQEAILNTWLCSYIVSESFNRLVEKTTLTVSNADCNNCTSPSATIFFPPSHGAQVTPNGFPVLGQGDLTPDGNVRTLSSVPYDVSGVPTGHIIAWGVNPADWRFLTGQPCTFTYTFQHVSDTASSFSWSGVYKCVAGVITDVGNYPFGGSADPDVYGCWVGTNLIVGAFTIDVVIS